MKIYAISPDSVLTDGQKNSLNLVGELINLNTKNLNQDDLLTTLADADILMTGSSCINPFSKEMFDKLPNLKFVSLTCVGTDWIDIQAARNHQVSIAIAKGANAESVAEHAWGMILDLSKRITESDRVVRTRQAYSFSDFGGHEVFGETLGIVGLGNVGEKIARIGKAFSMRIIAYDVFQRDIPGIEWNSLDQLCATSDVICISIPLNKSTEGMINQSKFNLMKPETIVVNIAREQIVDKPSLINALQQSRIKGYGLEASINNHIEINDIYLSFPQVIVTPHIAFNTIESKVRTLDLAISNIQAYIKHQPQNLI